MSATAATTSAPPSASANHSAAGGHEGTPHGPLPLLALGALGVVYGDIGTSPLYALKECFTKPHGVDPSVHNIYGILSLFFWALTLVVVVKYLTYIMRADNKGEGGILALLALVVPRDDAGRLSATTLLIMLGLFGAALLYGDGVITPAISVLSAVEGLDVATPVFKPYIVPITVAILVALFLAQRRGTAGIGAIFGPAMLIWFGAISAMGVPWILKHPNILGAVNPIHALNFFKHNAFHGFLVLGAVVLCITGGEALYADMGHFGKRPIRWAWYVIVFPALLLCYFGQGAMLLVSCQDPASAACKAALNNPFFSMISGWMVYPMVVVATVATVVASQALISGAFSLTQQAVQLGYCPRVNIIHTSDEAEGQIYIPEVNTALMVACVALVLTFKQSSALAAAYGIAVTGTMSITSVLFYAVARERWKWSAALAGSVVGLFLVVDLAFFAANCAKVTQGGWLPLVFAAGVFTLMTTWKRGRDALRSGFEASALPLDTFLERLRKATPTRVDGSAVFMTQNTSYTPPALLHYFKHSKVLHRQVIMLSVRTLSVPEVPARERIEMQDHTEGFWEVRAAYGFMQTPNVPEIMRRCRTTLKTAENDTSFFLGRETLLTTGKSGMQGWRKQLFTFMSRNARPATAFFGIPPDRVVELGTQIEL